MDILKKYAIAYKGLSEGKHTYEFELDNTFFNAFEGSEVTAGTGHVEVALTKGATMLEVDATIHADVTVVCDRCMEDCEAGIDYEGGFKVMFGDATEEFDGELMWLSQADSELNLAQYIYESIVLALPYKKIHVDSSDGRPGCNPEILAKVTLITQEEFDRAEEGSRMQKMEDNPEWQKLREIGNKL